MKWLQYAVISICIKKYKNDFFKNFGEKKDWWEKILVRKIFGETKPPKLNPTEIFGTQCI